MMDFQSFKQQRKTMTATLTQMNDDKQKRNNDNWFPTIDKQGNSYAVIRILPQKDVAKHPVAVYYKHKTALKSLLCPSSFGTMKDCPLCQIASQEWLEQKNNCKKDERPKVESYRKPVRVCSIYIKNDPSDSNNNGKVKKFYLPSDLYDKIQTELFPPKDKQGNPLFEPRAVYDLWEGADFIISIKKGNNGYNDYSDSKFAPTNSPIAESDEEIQKIYDSIPDIEPKREDLPIDIVDEWNRITNKKVNSTIEEDDKKAETSKPVTNVVKQSKSEESFSMSNIETKSSIQQSEPKTEDVDEDDKLPWE